MTKIKIAFVISLAGHCLFLGMHGFNLAAPNAQEKKDITLEIKIKRQPLLPKIDVMGKEKKIKKIKKEVIENPEPKEHPKEAALKKDIIEKPKQKPHQESVKVNNPQKEAMLRYQDMIKQRIEQARRYPSWARKRKTEGTIYLRFTVLPNGTSQEIRILRSSGSKKLDKEAVFTIKRAEPFPSAPKEICTSQLQMEIAIVFKLSGSIKK